MKTKLMLMAVAALWLGAHVLAFGQYVEIGNGINSSSSVPVDGYWGYGWSQAIYPEGELGGPMLIHGISYNVANTPVDYVMPDQRIYLKQTAVSAFTSGTYDDPDAAGFTKVFEGTVTWNGAGWQTIEFDTPFLYTGTGNLIVYWQNHDGDWDSGYPTFRYTSVSYTVKYQHNDGSFPVSSGGSWGSARANIRIHYTNWQPSPADGAAAVSADAVPALAWNNPEGTVSNAVYFSTSAVGVSEMNPGVCVQPAGTYPYAAYTNATPLVAGTTYYWCVRAFLEGSQMVGGPFSFTTEPTAQASYPWSVDFENGGAMPPFWHQEKIAGDAVWSARAAGVNNAPNAPWNGSYLATFGGAGGGATTRLLAPVLDLGDTAAPVLTFMHAQPALGGACDTLRVYWRNARTNDWQMVPDGAFTAAVPDWTRQTLALPSPSATYYIAFEGMDTGGGGVALDDVFVLEETGSLTLEIFDSYGDPLANAALAVFAPGSDHDYEKARSDAGGRATFHGLPSGGVRYRTDEGFHNVVDDSLTLGAAGHVTQRVDLVAAIHLGGVIRASDETRNRIEGATVSLLAPSPGSEVVASDQTDAFGQYRFSRVTAGDYRIQAIHPAYVPAETGLTVNASMSQDLTLAPRQGNFFDVHVQVNCVLSGLPITDSSVEITVHNAQGAEVYRDLALTDADGKLCFRGVLPGDAVFVCNHPDHGARAWWEAYTSPAQVVANAKLVQIRLEPKKGATALNLAFSPTTPWGQPKEPVAPYIQNFWVEACGYDPVTGNELYPPRTALTDSQGGVAFTELPTLPTKLTVRRPGFVPQSVLITPDQDAVFPSLVEMARPAITPGTTWDLTIQQDLFKRMPGETSSGAPGVNVNGLPNSNTEGFSEDFYRYAMQPFETPPVPINTDHGQMGVWGQGQYLITPGEYGYIMTEGGMEGFYCNFQFPPHLAVIAEGENNHTVIQATVAPSVVEGVLYAADEVSDEGITLYKPVPNKEVHFVLHENVRFMYNLEQFTYTTMTDSNGCYSLQIPPGKYGIEIPALPGYWGCKVESTSLIGWSGNSGGWPYAYTNAWNANAINTSVYRGYGIALGSDHQTKLDLFVNRDRYVVQTKVSQYSPMTSRLIYSAPDASQQVWRPVIDPIESETTFSLSNGATAPIRQYYGGLRAVWTNLTGGTLTLSDDSHSYLSCTADVSRATFAWGGYPGQPPATEPPYGTVLNQTPLPMIAHWMQNSRLDPDHVLTNAPTINVTYYTGNDENPTAETTTTPDMVAYKDLPGRIYNCGSIDRERVQTYYFAFMLHDGSRKIYAVPGEGPYAVNTITAPPASLPLSPYELEVVAVNMDNPAEVINDFPFNYDGNIYTTPRIFQGVTTSPYVDWDYNAPGGWQRYVIRYSTLSTNTPLRAVVTLFTRPRVYVTGTVKNAVSGLAVSGAAVEMWRSDGSSQPIVIKSNTGSFNLGTFYSWEGHLLKVTVPGYYPYQRRYVLKNYPCATNSTSFSVSLGDIALTPVSLNAASGGWDRRGYVLHGVQAAGSAEQPETGNAIQMTVDASASVPSQTYNWQKEDAPNGSPGTLETVPWDDRITDVWLVDARYKNATNAYVPYASAEGAACFPDDPARLPPASDPDRIWTWLQTLLNENQVMIRMSPETAAAAVTVTGQVNVATLRPGAVVPMLVIRAESGACKLAPFMNGALTSVELPRWLAFAADTFAAAASAQGAYADLKETYASNVPDGKLSALPSLSGGITESGGYLSYAYELGVSWEEGAEAPAEGGLGVGPGLLGLQFESKASVGFNGANQALSFEVGGTVGKEEIDLADYAPAFLQKLGIEGTINRVAGSASTRRSTALDGGLWSERELCTDVGASIDLTLRYNLEGITGKLPYVGPLLTAADKTGALQLFGRLDAGGALQNTTTWRTVEPERSQEIGADNPLAERPITLREDDKSLTPNRHCFGGQENSAGVYENEFKLGVSFAAGFEGSALGDHLNLHAGIAITGGENDLVAGQPSLVITPNTFGDWPPIKRAQGDVNAFIKARLDAYVTEIEKEWTINLARIDHQFTTESTITLSDLGIQMKESPVESTLFTGQAPAVVRNLPKGASFAQAGGLLAFGMFDKATLRTALAVSEAQGDGFGEPVVIDADAEGLGRVLLAQVGPNVSLLVWEERPGVVGNPAAYSVLHAARCLDGEWQTPHTVLALNGYLSDMAVFASTVTTSLVIVQSPVLYDCRNTAIRAVGYDRASDTWGTARTVQSLDTRRGWAMASAGWTSPEPGRLITLAEAGGVDSLYWDGSRSCVSGGVSSVRLSGAVADAVALCAAGTNEQLYATWVDADGAVNLNRYDPDPLRDPLGPDYDWNGCDAATMWPAVTTLAQIDGVVIDVANAWLPDGGPLLSVWSVLGNLHAHVYDTAGEGSATNVVVAASPGGWYSDVTVSPLSNGLARVSACYTSNESRELRVFIVDTGFNNSGNDLDGDGILDALELALVDAGMEDEVADIRDVDGDDDFDGDGFSNAAEWAAGTRADIAASYPRLGVRADAVSPLAREDGLLPGRVLISRSETDAAGSALTVHYAISGTSTEGVDYETLPRSIQIAAGERSAVVTVQPLTDTEVEGDESVALALLPNAGYTLCVDTQATVRIRDASRDAWRGSHFTPAQLVLPNISGDDADPDHDGIPNALERALGTDPWLADPTELDMALADGYLYLGYRYDPLVEDAVITINASTNLLESVWTPAAGTLLYREPLPDQREELLYRIPLQTPAGFYRLKLEVP